MLQRRYHGELTHHRHAVGMLSVLAGAGVANLYYSQPLLGLMARTFDAPPARLGTVPMMTQIGYAIGLLAFVPLADAVDRRKLMTRLLLLTAAALGLAAAAPSVLWLDGASLLIGLFTVVPQIALPLAADIAIESDRGHVVGRVMSGLLIGILGARTISGLVGNLVGWRAMYELAAAFMALWAALVFGVIPQPPPANAQALSPFRLFASLPRLWREEPVLRSAALTGGGLFAALSTFWTTLTFRLGGPPYHYPPALIGLFGLAGAASASAAPLAGRLADRRDPRYTVWLGLLGAALAYAGLWVFSSILLLLILATLLLDLATNTAHIANQARIYRVRADSRARSNTLYMVVFFTGGACGSGLGSAAWHWAGWPGAMGSALAWIVLAMVAHRSGRTPGERKE
ncbi:MAG: MFS transporter [Thermaerobacter sp.]|nr:MFS transporter [Thermaerobacter sp.]